MAFDEANHMIETVDPLGQHWRQEWDERGLLTGQSTPMGSRSRFTYDAHGQLLTHINPRGAVTTLAFDRYGCISELSDALGQRNHFENNALGKLKRSIDPVSDVTEYHYDVKGRLLQMHQANGDSLRCNYDAEDRLTSYIDQSGSGTRLEYAGIGQIAKRVLADGKTVQYLYDTEEQIVAVINQRQETYQLKRDELGRIIEEKDYWGQARQYSYDAGGGLLGASDPLGRMITYATDRVGRIVKKTLPDSDNPGLQIHETFKYDKRGALVEIRNPHRHILRKFDADGRLSEEIQDGFEIKNSYDEAGNLLSRRTSAGNTVISTFDLCDRLTTIAINQELPILIERDALGRAVKEQLSSDVQRRLRYDSAGRLTAQTVLRDQAPLFSTSYDYDRAGNQIRRNDSEHGNDLYQYDLLGNLLRHTDPAGRVAELLTDPAGDRLRTSIRQVQAKQAAGAEGAAEPVWTREGSYEGMQYVFDRAGNLIHRENQRSVSAATPASEPALQLRWDANQRLIESNNSGQITRYGYDPLGRRVFKRNPMNTTWFFWDGDVLLGEVQQANDAINAATCWSDNIADLMAARRRLNALKALHAQVREFVYHPGTFVPLALIDRQAKVSKAAADMARPPASALAVSAAAAVGGMSGMGSHRLGQQNPLASLSRVVDHRPRLSGAPAAGSIGLGAGVQLGGTSDIPSGVAPEVVSSTITASANTTVSVKNDGASEAAPGSVFHYHNDPNGCPLRLTDGRGQVVWSASYAAWGALRQSHVQEVNNPIRYQGQYFDGETGLHYNRHRYYDPNIGQFIGLDPIGLSGGDNPYFYGHNPISWIDPWGLATGDYKNMQTIPGYQKHHIIPQNLADHPVIKASGYDIHSSRNIVYLPTTGVRDPARTVHRGMHTNDYNLLVEARLDAIHRTNASADIKKMQIGALSDELGNDLRNKKIRLNAAC
jgi:RHS repeat-associated protein